MAGKKGRDAKAWSAEEDKILRKMWGAGFSTTQIAAKLPLRSRGAVAARAGRLNLPLRDAAAFYKKRRADTIPRNAAEIVAMHVNGMTASQIGKQIGKTRDWVLNLVKILRREGWDIPCMKGRKATWRCETVETYCDHVFYLVKPGGQHVPVTSAEITGRAA